MLKIKEATQTKITFTIEDKDNFCESVKRNMVAAKAHEYHRALYDWVCAGANTTPSELVMEQLKNSTKLNGLVLRDCLEYQLCNGSSFNEEEYALCEDPELVFTHNDHVDEEWTGDRHSGLFFKEYKIYSDNMEGDALYKLFMNGEVTFSRPEWADDCPSYPDDWRERADECDDEKLSEYYWSLPNKFK